MGAIWLSLFILEKYMLNMYQGRDKSNTQFFMMTDAGWPSSSIQTKYHTSKCVSPIPHVVNKYTSRVKL